MSQVSDYINHASRPFFLARKNGREVVVTGNKEVFLGHRFESGHPEPEGIFAQWVWDGETLHIENDRYGAFPLFFYATEGTVIVATTVHQIVAQLPKADLDLPAISLFLCIGYFCGNDTPFKDIQCLGPGEKITWSLTKGIQHKIKGLPSIKMQSCTENEAIDTYIKLFAKAIERRQTSSAPLLHLLSGGRDSRHILFELVKQGRMPEKLITVELSRLEDSCSDVAIARMIAERLKIPHEIVNPQRVSFLTAELVKNQLTGFAGEEGAWMVPLLDLINESHHAVMFDGIAGDALSAGLFLDENRLGMLETGDNEAFIQDILIHNHLFFADTFEQASRLIGMPINLPMAKRKFIDNWKLFSEEHNPLTQFFFYNRTRRVIANCSYGMFHGAGCLYSPYLDNALYDFLCSLPVAMLKDKNFHNKVIAQAYPEYIDIPYTGNANISSLTIGALVQMKIFVELWLWALRNNPRKLAFTTQWLATYKFSNKARSLSRASYLILSEIMRISK